MANSSVVTLPADLNDIEAMRRFLTKLVEEVDTLLGYRGEDAAVTQEDITTLKEQINAISTGLAQQVITVNTASDILATTGLTFSQADVITDYTTAGNETIRCINTAPITITMRDAPLTSERVYIIQTDARVTVDGRIRNINGSPSILMNTKKLVRELLYNAASNEWLII